MRAFEQAAREQAARAQAADSNLLTLREMERIHIERVLAKRE